MARSWPLRFVWTIGKGNKASQRGEHDQAVRLYRAAGQIALDEGAMADAALAVHLSTEDVAAAAGPAEAEATLREVVELCRNAEDFVPAVKRFAGGRSVDDLRAEALDDLIEISRARGDHERLAALHLEAREVALVNGGRYDAADHLAHQGNAYHSLGRSQKARECWTTALEEMASLGDATNAAELHRVLAAVLLDERELAEALDHASRALTGFRRSGVAHDRGRTQSLLARIRHAMGDVAGAVADHERAVADMGSTASPSLLLDFAATAHRLGRRDEAVATVETAFAASAEAGDEAQARRALIRLAEIDLPRALPLARQCVGRSLTFHGRRAAEIMGEAAGEFRADGQDVVADRLLDEAHRVLVRLLERPDADPVVRFAAVDTMRPMVVGSVGTPVHTEIVARTRILLDGLDLVLVRSEELRGIVNELADQQPASAVELETVVLDRLLRALPDPFPHDADDSARRLILDVWQRSLTLRRALAAAGRQEESSELQTRRLGWARTMAASDPRHRDLLALTLAAQAAELDGAGHPELARLAIDEAVSLQLELLPTQPSVGEAIDAELVFLVTLADRAGDTASARADLERRLGFLRSLGDDAAWALGKADLVEADLTRRRGSGAGPA